MLSQFTDSAIFALEYKSDVESDSGVCVVFFLHDPSVAIEITIKANCFKCEKFIADDIIK